MKWRGFDVKKSRAMPDRKPFLALLQQALENIREEQLFNDERGFQGALLQELSERLPDGVQPEDPMLQQEYQKRFLRHGIRIRPDIIIHVPFERGVTESREEGNFVAMELKRRATNKTARGAFTNLAKMKKALKYPLTIFINIDSNETHSALCPKSIAGQTVCFAVRLENGRSVVRTEASVRPAKKEQGG
jgi:hypothetical protein